MLALGAWHPPVMPGRTSLPASDPSTAGMTNHQTCAPSSSRNRRATCRGPQEGPRQGSVRGGTVGASGGAAGNQAAAVIRADFFAAERPHRCLAAAERSRGALRPCRATLGRRD
jgi:hypothetical protein